MIIFLVADIHVACFMVVIEIALYWRESRKWLHIDLPHIAYVYSTL